MNKPARSSVAALIALCCTAALAACSATKGSLPSGALLQQPDQAQAVADSRLQHALVAFNSNTGALAGCLLDDASRLTAGLVEFPMLSGDDGRVDGVALDRRSGLYRARHHNLTDVDPVAF